MGKTPTLVFVPGSWHKPACYDKVIKLLHNEHNIKCFAVTLPSTSDNPEATFKDDIDATRNAIISETTEGNDVIIIAHSYGGMVGNSAIKGLARPKTTSSTQSSTDSQTQTSAHGYVTGLILIASGYTLTGIAFMDPFFGRPPPAWRVDKETGYAVLVANPREFFYHDLSDQEAEYWVSQLTTQSLKALFEGGEHAYAGWQDVPNWYIGTVEDRGLPVLAQRMTVGLARGQGAVVHHTELNTSHSPFLSMPEAVTSVIVDAVSTVSGAEERVNAQQTTRTNLESPTPRLLAPTTWFKYGLPLLVGRVLGGVIFGFIGLRRLLGRK